MPGLLSHLFDGDQHNAASGSDDGDSAHGSSTANSLDGSAHLNSSVSFHTEQSGSIETLDGTTHSWDNEQDVAVAVDAEAIFGLTHNFASDSIAG